VRARIVASVADVEIKTLPCRIADLRPLAPDVMQLRLRLPAVERLRFHPGQYLDVLLESGRRRSFSIANPPHSSELIELHVRRVSGGGFSERLFGPPRVWAPPPRRSLQGHYSGSKGRSGNQLSPRLGPGAHGRWRYGFRTAEVDAAPCAGNGYPARHPLLLGARHTQDLYEEELVLEWVRRHPQLMFTPYCRKRPRPKPRIIARLGA